jgi:peptide/nickel transport system ATP-binding protein
MYAGRIVESGPVEQVLNAPLHPYTRGLLDSVPANNARGQRLHQIPGMTPSLVNRPKGCAFRNRCSFAGEDCAVDPPVREFADHRLVRCVRPLLEAKP